MNLETTHIPVLLDEVLAGLQVHPGGRYLDATVGGGGHAAAILEASAPDGRLLGLDRDPEAAERTRERLAVFGSRYNILHTSYIALSTVVHNSGLFPLDGVLFDLGFSSWQVDDPQRGFAFREDGPLDMRFDPTSAIPTAGDLLNELPEADLVDILREYGEEPKCRRIAREIVSSRPIRSTRHLAEVVQRAVGYSGKSRRHPATLTFQALRIAVNRELEGIEKVLPQALSMLRPGGRLAVITFHSLEDRIVKQFMRRESRDCICPPDLPVCVCGHKAIVRLVTRKPVVPGAEEIQVNPRSRSAKLRVVEKLNVS
ncbi:MAG: 16S rRNA (cytosine(1402)-N(4))-methyltransferase RsmH [Anaerolineae bacterium]|nr:16S rRNA (cytosine(1402)-N(4))-methyltransferase RsmH [Anaerolineae bacterium]